MLAFKPLQYALIGCIILLNTVSAAAADYAGKKIIHIDSYHAGNLWNDTIADAIRDTLQGTGVELRIFHLDSKRQPEADSIAAAARQAQSVIDDFQPDVIITSDDNAARYLIMPYYRDVESPVVFCGLNWDASIYGLPYRNVTGMVEVSPIPQIVRLLKTHSRGNRIGYLTENTLTKQKELDYHRQLFDIDYDQVYLVDTFEDWKAAFLRAQNEVDMLMILGVGALTDWDENEARKLAEQYTRIPAGTDFAWLMQVALIGIAKLPEEQGQWAARAALKILDGTPPDQIPLTYNREGKLYFNTAIANRLGILDIPPLAETVP